MSNSGHLPRENPAASELCYTPYYLILRVSAMSAEFSVFFFFFISAAPPSPPPHNPTGVHEEVCAKIQQANWTTCRPDHRKETQTEVVWTCLPFFSSGRNHLARQSERGKKTRKTEKEVERQHMGLDRPAEFAKSQRAVENREKWRKLTGKSSVVALRPSRLRDRRR